MVKQRVYQEFQLASCAITELSGLADQISRFVRAERDTGPDCGNGIQY